MASTLSPEQIQYMEAHITDSKAHQCTIANVVCLVAAYIGVALRFVSRRASRVQLSYDDWTIVVALIGFTGWIAADSMWLKYGGGKHIIAVTEPKAMVVSIICAECFYCLAMLFIKASLLCLYGRIFPQPRFRIALWVTGGVVLTWFVANIFVNAFQCVPIAKAWDPTMPGYCVDYGSFLIAVSTVNVLTDIVILVLPMPLVWRLQMSRQKKWLVTVTFLLGGSACLASVARLGFLRQAKISKDATWDNVGPSLTSTIELGIGLLAACVATWRTLFNRVFLPSRVESDEPESPLPRSDKFQSNTDSQTSEQITLSTRISVTSKSDDQRVCIRTHERLGSGDE